MGFTVEEDPIGMFEDFLAGIDDTWLDIIWGVEYFASEISCWSDDDKPEINAG